MRAGGSKERVDFRRGPAVASKRLGPHRVAPYDRGTDVSLLLVALVAVRCEGQRHQRSSLPQAHYPRRHKSRCILLSGTRPCLLFYYHHHLVSIGYVKSQVEPLFYNMDAIANAVLQRGYDLLDRVRDLPLASKMRINGLPL